MLDYEVGSVHPFCTGAKLPGAEICRGLANDVLEFANEVCLIGQAAAVGDLRPGPVVSSFREDFLKTRQACKSLRTDAKSGIEGARKLTWTGPQFCSQGINLHGWVFPEMPRRAVGKTIGMRTKTSKQEGMDTRNSFFACPRGREHVVTHGHFPSTKQISKMHVGVCELLERGFHYAARRVRPKAHNDDAKCPRRAQGNGVRLNVSRALRRQKSRALMYSRRRSVLTDQVESGARSAFDRNRLCEISIRNVKVPDSLKDVGKRGGTKTSQNANAFARRGGWKAANWKLDEIHLDTPRKQKRFNDRLHPEVLGKISVCNTE
jgi:hypothetical protein